MGGKEPGGSIVQANSTWQGLEAGKRDLVFAKGEGALWFHESHMRCRARFQPDGPWRWVGLHLAEGLLAGTSRPSDCWLCQ